MRVSGAGFSVDVEALRSAGEGIVELMRMLDQHKVEDIDCDSAAVGHGELAGKLESFCGRWQVGVENLLEDGKQISQRLLDSAKAYSDSDQAAATALSGGASGG
jgi:hypothetical protein